MDGIKKAWPLMLIRGLISIAFGCLIIFYPVLSLRLLMVFFGAYVLVWGGFTIFTAIASHKSQPQWGVTLIEGLIALVIGISILVVPKLSEIMVLYIVALWALITGVAQLWIAIKWRAQVKNDFWLGLAGILGILFGILIIAYPADGILAVAWLLGMYAILAGFILSILALKLRKLP